MKRALKLGGRKERLTIISDYKMNTFQSPRRELQEGKKHRGLLIIDPDLEKAREHLAKAEHNLKVTFHLQKGGYTDWCSSSLFYVIYHCFLAMLAKYGYESRNQECTFAVIAALCEDGKIALDTEDLEQVSSMSVREAQEAPNTTISLREEYQYSTRVSLENNEYQRLLSLAKHILDKTKDALEEL